MKRIYVRSDRKWIMHLGDNTYNLLLWINIKLNVVRRKFGLEYWSLSKSLKTRTKRAMNFINSFEETVADYCRRKDFDGAICGHIHVAEMREIDGIVYMNDGDWVESCTALVEHHDGRWELLQNKPKHMRKKRPIAKPEKASRKRLSSTLLGNMRRGSERET